MNPAHVDIWWQNDTTPALNDTNLGQINSELATYDSRIITLDTTKANQSDLLTALSNVTYNTSTGVFTFTWKNGTTATFDLNIEKIPVSFSMDANGVITMTTADGTTYTADVKSILVLYTFSNSSRIAWTVTQNGNNYTVSADIVDGSITAEKLQPNFLADCQAAKNAAEAAATTATNKATLSESYAVGGTGTRAGEDTDNAKYYMEQAAAIAQQTLSGLSDVTITSPQNGDTLVYDSNSSEWINGKSGILPHVIVISDTGSTVTLTKGLKVISATETSTGHFEADVDEYGTWTIDSVLAGDDAQTTLNIDAVKVYTITDKHFSSSITVSYPSGGTCTLSATGQTPQAASSSPYTFTVHEAATYTLAATYRGVTKSTTIVISTTGQTETYSFLVDGATVLTTDDVEIWLDCACLWDKAYTTEAEIIADSEALLALISDSNAVDYMVRSTSFRTLICADSLAMLYIGQYNDCADSLLANSTWLSAICSSEYYDLVLTNLVPEMTSATTPSGTVTASGEMSSSTPAYAAFNKERKAWMVSNNNYNAWIQYEFSSGVTVIGLESTVWHDSSSPQYYPSSVTLSGSNDGSTWTDIETVSINNTPGAKTSYAISNSNRYKYYRLKNWTTSGAYVCVGQIQFYGRDDVTPPASRPLKTFATATEAEILEMVCKADRGEIDLYDDAGWRVGQEHQISLTSIPYSNTGGSYYVGESQSAQTATLVLMHKGLYELVNSVLDKQGQTRNTCSFVVGLKDCLSAAGYMNGTNTNSGSWDGCARRKWCNYGLRNAISPCLRSAFKQFKTITAETRSGTTNKISTDYFALFAEKEIQGSRTYSNQTESAALTQITYYETNANKIKQLSGTNYGWWNRSPASVNDTEICAVRDNGNAMDPAASGTYGVSPFGCL